MAMASLLRRSVYLFIVSLCILSGVMAQPPPPKSLAPAAEALANSGYSAMSLTISLIGETLPYSSDVLTIFSPSDKAFASSSELPMDHLLQHFSPMFLTQKALVSLPFASTIPTLSHSGDLIVTSDEDKISVDNVRVSKSPLFDDGFVIVYGIDDFFKSDFTLNSKRQNEYTLMAVTIIVIIVSCMVGSS